MVARQTAAGNGQVVVQRLGECEVIAIGQRVEGQIAGVDDDIGARRIDVFTHAPKIFGEYPRETGKMSIGNLANVKFAHGPNSLLANSNHTTRVHAKVQRHDISRQLQQSLPSDWLSKLVDRAGKGCEQVHNGPKS